LKLGLKRLKRIATRHPQAGLILLLFITLAVIYSLVTPPFEAGDESRHYAVVKYIADTGHLPVQNLPATQNIQPHWSHEGNQPPLYYALAAALTGWIDTGGWDEVFQYNPHTTIGNPLRPDNKNITIHPPGESWPWRGHILAVHLIRLLSIGMAGVTVVTAYALALRLLGGQRWLAAAAMALTAFNPMFIFISAAVNNDNAVIMFVTLTLYQLTMSSQQLTMSNEQLTKAFHLPTSPSPLSNPPPKTNPPALPSFGLAQDKPASPPILWLRSGQACQPSHPSILPFVHIILLGLLLGLGALSKLYAFGLLPLCILVFIGVAYRQALRQPTSLRATSHVPGPTSFSSGFNHTQAWQKIIFWSAILLFVFALVAGWFYVRNAILYDGDFFALDVMRETAGQRREAPTLATLRAEFEGFRIAYWALFGGVNILADPWIYTVLDTVSLVALTGLVIYLPKVTWYALMNNKQLGMNKEQSFDFAQDQPANPPHLQPSSPPPLLHLPTFLILLTWAAIMVAGFIAWNLTQPAGQGRLLYPAIAAISALGILGLTWWLPTQKLQRLVATGCAVGLFLFAAAVPFVYIAPAYAKTPILTEADLPADLQPLEFTYDGTMRLIGYQLHTPLVRPAEAVQLTLFWQILRPSPLDYSLFVHLLGRSHNHGREVIGQIDTYPGGGAWPTTLLAPGDVVADTYQITVRPEAEFGQAPTRLQIVAGIYDFNEPGRPGRPALNAAGQPVDPIIGWAKLIPWQWPEPERLVEPVNFSEKAQLLNYHIAADRQSVTLTWQAVASFEADYTVFLQVWQANSNEYETGFDGPPVQNNYPTSLWAPGEIIIDTHPLDLTHLPPGEYKLLAGLYHPTTGERLPASGLAGPLPDFAVNLGRITISQ
jgi:4-amino-4-deoxy-L-arabinose transferase-like glycosyltransferase